MEDTSGSEESGEGNENSTNDPSTDKKQKNCKSKKGVKRKTFSFGKWQKGFNKDKNKKRNFSLSKDAWQSSCSVVSEASIENVTCICTGYRKTKASSSVDKANKEPQKESSASQEPPLEASGGSYLTVSCQGNTSGDESWAVDASMMNRRVPAPRDYATQQNPEASNSNLFITCQNSQQPLSINEISISELTLALQEHMRLSIVQSPSFLIQYGNVGYNVNNSSERSNDRRSCSLNLFSHG
ncbi:hypothetical protein JTE90_024019 [Oedothorax gibbosus]|uniref:Uncharacterized protein n=1 Tax=Oedothorax gibbosus TaxID=931172 RepID=A0AAV6VBB8_9ARAC|nr:hypothetical protein JTE90_024019 [Oedothorax gibbosus]